MCVAPFSLAGSNEVQYPHRSRRSLGYAVTVALDASKSGRACQPRASRPRGKLGERLPAGSAICRAAARFGYMERCRSVHSAQNPVSVSGQRAVHESLGSASSRGPPVPGEAVTGMEGSWLLVAVLRLVGGARELGVVMPWIAHGSRVRSENGLKALKGRVEEREGDWPGRS